MRIFVVLYFIGIQLFIEGATILLTSLWSLFAGEECFWGLLYSAIVILSIGGFMIILSPKTKNVNVHESLLIVVLGWAAISSLGALPFIFTGAIPRVTDAIFESVSGFTTTGASILADVESLPQGVLLWRSLTHFLGGIGIIVFALSVIPMAGVGGMSLMRSENPALMREQLVPQLGVWLRNLFYIYAGIIGLETVLLMTAGFSFFDAVTHSFGTVATGGFSTKNQSLASFHNIYAEIIVTVFMFMGGMNFAVYYQLMRKRFRAVLREDVVFYLVFTASVILLATLVNWYSLYTSFGESLRYSSFNVVSLNTTTGFANADFNNWPGFTQFLLILLMLVGACAGSTSGAIKNIRFVILWKCFVRELKKMLHPFGVFVVRINDHPVEEMDLLRALLFVAAYICLFLLIAMVLPLTGLDIVESLSASAACLGGVGPGLKSVGPMGNYAHLTGAAKWILIAAMLWGRLEIFSFFVIIKPGFWKSLPIKK